MRSSWSDGTSWWMQSSWSAEQRSWSSRKSELSCYHLLEHQLCKVVIGRVVDNLCDGLKTAHFHSSVSSLEQPETPVGSKLSVSNDECDRCIPAGKCAPNKILHHAIIHILAACTSFSPIPWFMKKCSWLTTVLAPFPQSPASFVRDSVNTKNRALPWCEEVCGTRL